MVQRPSVWRRLQLNGMQQDFSWESQGKEYEQLYARLAVALR